MRRLFAISLLIGMLASACAGGESPTTVDRPQVPGTTTGQSTVPRSTSEVSSTRSSDVPPPTTIAPRSTTAAPQSSSTIVATPDTAPPHLAVTDPSAGDTVGARTYRFRGITEPGCSVIAAGRYEANVDVDGNWSIVLVLNEGGNLASFTARDAAGNTTTVKVPVRYEPTETKGSIAGSVLDGEGLAAPGEVVLVFREPDERWNGGFANTLTDAAGAWRIDELPPGEWHVMTGNWTIDRNSAFARQCWGGSFGERVCESGNTVHVVAGTVTSGIDFVGRLGGAISGRITDEATGAPLVGFEVCVTESWGDEWCTHETDANGYFSIGGLLGRYRLYATSTYGWDETDFRSWGTTAVKLGETVTGVDMAFRATPHPPTNLALTHDVSPSRVSVGDTVVYTVALAYTGPPLPEPADIPDRLQVSEYVAVEVIRSWGDGHLTLLDPEGGCEVCFAWHPGTIPYLGSASIHIEGVALQPGVFTTAAAVIYPHPESDPNLEVDTQAAEVTLTVE